MSLPVTRIPERRRTVVDALLKITEVGFLHHMAKEWVPEYPRESREDPGFRSASSADVQYRMHFYFWHTKQACQPGSSGFCILVAVRRHVCCGCLGGGGGGGGEARGKEGEAYSGEGKIYIAKEEEEEEEVQLPL